MRTPPSLLDFGDNVGRSGRIPAGDQDVSARVCESKGGCTSDPASGSGDDGHPPVEAERIQSRHEWESRSEVPEASGLSFGAREPARRLLDSVGLNRV